MKAWTIDNKHLQANKEAKVGDILIDDNDDMHVIFSDNDEGYSVLCITNGKFDVYGSYETIKQLLKEFDEWGTLEVVPAEKVKFELS